MNKFLDSIGIDKPKLLDNSKTYGNVSVGDYVEKAIKESSTRLETNLVLRLIFSFCKECVLTNNTASNLVLLMFFCGLGCFF